MWSASLPKRSNCKARSIPTKYTFWKEEESCFCSGIIICRKSILHMVVYPSLLKNVLNGWNIKTRLKLRYTAQVVIPALECFIGKELNVHISFRFLIWWFPSWLSGTWVNPAIQFPISKVDYKVVKLPVPVKPKESNQETKEMDKPKEPTDESNPNKEVVPS